MNNIDIVIVLIMYLNETRASLLILPKTILDKLAIYAHVMIMRTMTLPMQYVYIYNHVILILKTRKN